MPEDLLLRHRSRRDGHLLAMSPEPNLIAEDGLEFEIVRIVHGRRDLYGLFDWHTRCTRSMLAELLDFCL